MTKAKAKDPHKVLMEQGHLIDNAVRHGVREALIRHKERGLPVVIERDGKIEWVSASELLDEQPMKVAERPDSEYGETD